MMTSTETRRALLYSCPTPRYIGDLSEAWHGEKQAANALFALEIEDCDCNDIGSVSCQVQEDDRRIQLRPVHVDIHIVSAYNCVRVRC